MINSLEKIEYNNLNNEFKEYINKAIEVFATIKNNFVISINSMQKLEIKKSYYSITDKEILALFFASFLVDGSLKDILSKYKRLNIDAFLSDIDITRDDIKKLDDSEYENLYNNYFISYFRCLLFNTLYYNNGTINQENIYMSLVDNYDSAVIIRSIMINHDALLDYAASSNELRGILNHNIDNFTNINSSYSFFNDNNINHTLRDELKNDLNSKDMKSILDSIESKFVGQENACKKIFYNVVFHKKLVDSNSFNWFKGNAMILGGSMGTGKTAMIREIAEKFDVPYITSFIYPQDVEKLTSILSHLYKVAGGNLEKAENGILVFENFGNVLYNSKDVTKSELIKKEEIQNKLLRYLTGDKYTITVDNPSGTERKIEFDTSKLMFIFTCDLSLLKNDNIDLLKSEEAERESISNADFNELGLLPILSSRIAACLHTKQYTMQDLLKILINSTISPMLDFEKWIRSRGKYLVVEDGVYEKIALVAYELNSGSRSLQQVMGSIKTYFLKDVLSGNNKEINLNVDVINKIYGYTVNGKSRE